MEIRKATEADIPEIVALLKVSLGESLIPKSERYWRWKHEENPFGSSPVLVCSEGGALVGVRAFMRWEWIQDGKIYKAVRAVDTATHPEFQGKGIFKKLTMALVDSSKEYGDDFVFNTPNLKSKPGYLKMGWEEAGKLAVTGSIQKPFSMLQQFVGAKEGNKQGSGDNTISYYLQHQNLRQLLMNCCSQTNKMVTNASPRYLKWRYNDVPVADYVAVGFENGNQLTGLIIARIKSSRLGREFRITDCFVQDDCDGKEFGKKLETCKKNWDIDYTTWSASTERPRDGIFRGLNFTVSMGPVVTIRSLAMDDLARLKNFNGWSPSLGDLELF